MEKWRWIAIVLAGLSGCPSPMSCFSVKGWLKKAVSIIIVIISLGLNDS
ncbi:hypothetical Protein YC6258_02552 [Gynuella sunshinyii YC6258]|uniref:Uncharacterized protein n=1 Tax=Gynuella sunshinyii YC6258 TaxID=1445510 RepID=A0A0C5VJY7_9GAMM|nr:hypothetical Protein YC6258_02552 [Gynuella sunshinyii YC6258]